MSSDWDYFQAERDMGQVCKHLASASASKAIKSRATKLLNAITKEAEERSA